MDKSNAGVYGQRNYSQMGDGHARGNENIQKEGSFGKTKNEQWKEYVMKDTGTGRPNPPTNHNQGAPDKGRELWKDKVIASRTVSEKPKAPTPPVKQVEKAKPVMTKSR